MGPLCKSRWPNKPCAFHKPYGITMLMLSWSPSRLLQLSTDPLSDIQHEHGNP